MRSQSSFGRSSPRSNYSRYFDASDEFEGETQTRRDSDYGVGGAMLPIFLNDLRRNGQQQQDLVEVTLELDNNSIYLCSVNPTAPVPKSDYSGGADARDVAESGILSRSLSATSRIRRKFNWLRSGSSRTSSTEPAEEHRTITAREARRIKANLAKLQRTRSSAQRALKGLRFINQTTGVPDPAEQWSKVEKRFESKAKDGLLAREDFGECIGMVDSKEFAVGIFDALARRRGLRILKITKEELHDFWLQISDQSFDARLQIFFDM